MQSAIQTTNLNVQHARIRPFVQPGSHDGLMFASGLLASFTIVLSTFTCLHRLLSNISPTEPGILLSHLDIPLTPKVSHYEFEDVIPKC